MLSKAHENKVFKSFVATRHRHFPEPTMGTRGSVERLSVTPLQQITEAITDKGNDVPLNHLLPHR